MSELQSFGLVWCLGMLVAGVVINSPYRSPRISRAKLRKTLARWLT